MISRLARQAGKWWHRCAGPGAVVLLYHRVAALPADPQLLAVSPEHFAQQMDFLARKTTPLPLPGCVDHLRQGGGPQRPVAVTFDDGYADNCTGALSVLNRYEIPATVFVTGGAVDSVGEFYWDELERLLLHPARLPARLRLTIAGKVHEWDLGGEPDGVVADGWNVVSRHPETLRQHAYLELNCLLRPAPHSLRQETLAQLRQQIGVAPLGRGSHRALTSGELMQLSAGGVEIGAHTMTHPVLSTIHPAEQAVEIAESKRRLEQILGQQVRCFAYPFGTRADYSRETVRLVGQAGFAAACANFQGILRRRTDILQIPRFIVRDWDGDRFGAELERFFDDK